MNESVSDMTPILANQGVPKASNNEIIAEVTENIYQSKIVLFSYELDL